MKVTIRDFKIEDIQNKIKWVNDQDNNEFLHYELPLEYEKTLRWFENKNNKNRYDAVIEYDSVPVGLIGLINIDGVLKKAEYYILLGDRVYSGKGIAKEATKLILEYAFYKLHLNKIYLYTETGNYRAQNLFESVGFRKIGFLMDDTLNRDGQFVDRFIYEILHNRYEAGIITSKYVQYNSVVQKSNIRVNSNNIYIKREDLVPYSFGGNKARKGLNFKIDIKNGNYNSVVTYGSSSSNHSRVISNLAASMGIPSYIISPSEDKIVTNNSKIMELLGSKVIYAPLDRISETIDLTIKNLEKEGLKPYFIPGGGHDDLGTLAYISVYNQILEFEREFNLKFDYIYFASGTGGTHAGLEVGKLLNNGNHDIVGISIGRDKSRGVKPIQDAINSMISRSNINLSKDVVERELNFEDKYLLQGYGAYNEEIKNVIKNVLIKDGIPLDATYTGKAFWGMLNDIKEKDMKDKNILFIHTGGTPLFFDDLEDLCHED